MELRDIVPIIFWPWFFVSVVILIRRAINRRTDRADDGPLPEVIPPPPVLDPGRPHEGSAGTGPMVPAPPESMPLLPPGTPLPPAVLPEGASIFDAPADLPATAPRASIAEMVRGIELPCDLTPLVGAERPVGARDAATFVTRTHDATTVGRSVGTELRRLDFELATRHATEVVATRGDDWLIVAVHADAADLERGGRKAFPTAGPGAVVVEVWTE